MAAVVVPPVSKIEPARGADDAPWNYRDMAKAIGVVIVGSIVAGAIAFLIAEALAGSGQDYEDDPAAFAVLLVSSFIVQELLLLWAALRFGPWKYDLGVSSLGLRDTGHVSWRFPAAIAVGALAIAWGSVGLFQVIGVDAGGSAPDEAYSNAAPFIVIVIGAVLMAPAIEEIFFRGFVFGGVRARSGWLTAAIASSVLFGAAHLSAYYFVSYSLIGLLFAWSYQRTGSLRQGIIAHAITNVVSVGISAGLVWFG